MSSRSIFQSTAIGSPKSKARSNWGCWASWLAGFSLLVAGAPLWLGEGAGRAQHLAQIPQSKSVASQVNVLFINPAIGNDAGGNGTERQPLKTITSALRVAGRNTVILLAPGTYSTQSGETFPLLLKTGVTIEGNPRTRGQDIVIRGGGVFCVDESGEQPLSVNGKQEQKPPSCAAASQNVTIVGANQAGLTGVTVTNPNPQGYGLWIESSSPVVVDNSFTSNSHDGISVNGNSAPLIRSNYVYDNGINGITVNGTSRPEVRDNVLSHTGIGINITQNAAPRLIGNRITNNKDGVVVEANAQPVLRNNIIINNEQDGLVAFASSRPDLGTAAESGGNTFRGNGRFDISNKTANQTIAAFGNQLGNRVEGRIDLAGQSSVATNNQQPTTAASPPSSVPTRPLVTPTPAAPNPNGVATARAALDNQQPTTAASTLGSESTRPQINPSAAVPNPSEVATARAALDNQQPTTAASPPGSETTRPQINPTPAVPSPSGVANPPAALNPSVSERKQETPLQVMSLTRLGNAQSLPEIKPTSPSNQSSVVNGNADNGISTSRSGNETTDNGQQTRMPPVSASSFPVPTSLNPQTPGGTPETTNQQPTPDNGQTTNSEQQTPETGRQITFEIPQPPPAPENSSSSSNKPVSSPPQSTQPPQKAPTQRGDFSRLPVLSPSPLPRWGGENNRELNSLTVPEQNTPLGNTDNSASVASPPLSLEPQGNKPDSSPAPDSQGLRYRVVVEANSDSQKAVVRSLVPDAFRTVFKGRTVMQVGLYSDRAYAEQMLQMFKSKGLKATIEQIK